MTHEESSQVFFQSGELYEITINPAKQYDNDLHRVAKQVHAMTVITSALKDLATFELYPELSEPRYGNKDRGSSPRWHYHGTFTLRDDKAVGEFLLNFIHMLRAFSDYSINPYRPEHWPEYIAKQQHIMRPLCHKYNAPYCITEKNNIFKKLRYEEKKGYFI